jgi:surface-anchored protein
VTAPAGHADDGDGELEQTVAPEEENVGGETVLNVGHVDIGPRFVDGAWRIQGRDDSQSPPVWRPLTDVVTQVVDAAVQQAPDDPDFGFLGADPGSDVYVIPQTQAPEVVWLGWNTQDPEVLERVNRGVTLTMHGVEGPGRFSVFLQNGDLGAPDVLWDGDEAGPQDLWVDLNTHTHANWVFTEPGVYVVDFEVSADLITGERVSDRAPLRFAGGARTDPRAAFAAGAGGEPTAQDDPAGETTATTPPDGAADSAGPAADEEDSSLSVVVIAVGVIVLALLAAVVTVTARGRRARGIAEAAEAAEDAGSGPRRASS